MRPIILLFGLLYFIAMFANIQRAQDVMFSVFLTLWVLDRRENKK